MRNDRGEEGDVDRPRRPGARAGKMLKIGLERASRRPI